MGDIYSGVLLRQQRMGRPCGGSRPHGGGLDCLVFFLRLQFRAPDDAVVRGLRGGAVFCRQRGRRRTSTSMNKIEDSNLDDVVSMTLFYRC